MCIYSTDTQHTRVHTYINIHCCKYFISLTRMYRVICCVFFLFMSCVSTLEFMKICKIVVSLYIFMCNNSNREEKDYDSRFNVRYLFFLFFYNFRLIILYYQIKSNYNYTVINTDIYIYI